MSDEQNQDREQHEDAPTQGIPAGEDPPTTEFGAQQPGSMRYQDPESTTPREPSVAEKRARRQAEQERETRARDAAEAAERKARLRKRIMIGGGVTVGVAALVGAYYAAKPDDVTATCSTNDSRVANDQYCDDSYVYSHGGHITNGVIFMPLPFGGGFQQYHYNYGGTVSNGRVSGGSTVKPPNANVNTRSGKTIQRGGFGVGGGKSGGGRIGGGSSGS